MQERAWWVTRWLELLDSYRFKKRLERARVYAREGNVLSVDFEGARVVARVQGSESEPYEVSLSLEPFSDEDWDYVIGLLAKKAIYSARLLAGQLPENIERVFIESGVNLFPFSLGDVRSRCSCPDKANPCKHIGAVYYQLADRFNEDPFVILQLRGRTKNQILDAIRQKRSPNPLPTSSATKISPEAGEKSAEIDLRHFWGGDTAIDPSLVVIVPNLDKNNILDILGDFPLARTEAEAVGQFLETVYRQMAERAVSIALRDND